MNVFNLFGEPTDLNDYQAEVENIRAHTVGPGTRYQYIQKICNFLIWLLQHQHETVSESLREVFLEEFNRPEDIPQNATVGQREEARKKLRDEMVVFLREWINVSTNPAPVIFEQLSINLFHAYFVSLKVENPETGEMEYNTSPSSHRSALRYMFTMHGKTMPPLFVEQISNGFSGIKRLTAQQVADENGSIDIETHSARKGASTFCSSGSTSCPSGVAVHLRAGWAMGGVQDRYLQYLSGDVSM